jgi:hypothetical protein
LYTYIYREREKERERERETDRQTDGQTEREGIQKCVPVFVTERSCLVYIYFPWCKINANSVRIIKTLVYSAI